MKFFNLSLNWQDAQSFCQSHLYDSVLAELTSDQELQAVDNLMLIVYKNSVWVGAYEITRIGQYVWWSDNATVLSPLWGANQPSNQDGQQTCVELINSTLNARSCALVQPFVCQIRIPDIIPEACLQESSDTIFIDGKCVKVFTNIFLTWSNAQNFCKQTFYNGTLVEPVNELEMRAVKALAKSLVYIEYMLVHHLWTKSVAAPLVERVLAAPLVERVDAAPLVERVNAAPLVERVLAPPLVERVLAAPLVERVDASPLDGKCWCTTSSGKAQLNVYVDRCFPWRDADYSDGQCLKMFNLTTNWTSAQATCSNIHNTSLVEMLNENDRLRLSAYSRRLGIDQFWVGAQDTYTNRTFYWVTTPSVTIAPNQWARSGPLTGQRCVAITASLLLDYVSCTSELYYICDTGWIGANNLNTKSLFRWAVSNRTTYTGFTFLNDNTGSSNYVLWRYTTGAGVVWEARTGQELNGFVCQTAPSALNSRFYVAVMPQLYNGSSLQGQLQVTSSNPDVMYIRFKVSYNKSSQNTTILPLAPRTAVNFLVDENVFLTTPEDFNFVSDHFICPSENPALNGLNQVSLNQMTLDSTLDELLPLQYIGREYFIIQTENLQTMSSIKCLAAYNWTSITIVSSVVKSVVLNSIGVTYETALNTSLVSYVYGNKTFGSYVLAQSSTASLCHPMGIAEINQSLTTQPLFQHQVYLQHLQAKKNSVCIKESSILTSDITTWFTSAPTSDVTTINTSTVTTYSTSDATLAGVTGDPINTSKKVLSECLCISSTAAATTPRTVEEGIEAANKIVTELKMNPKNVSSYRRTLTSALDQRRSSEAFGAAGVIIIAVVIAVFVISDVTYLWQFIHSFSHKG
uniref:C-type lectin domain-containing protein n=1 Tax=Biomphalaria glabrata TaxID=6526 RepID=A0A2C9KX57_BIOGL